MEVGDEVILKSLRNEKRKFNGKEAIVIRRRFGGDLSVRCCGLAVEVKKHQYKEVKNG